MEREQTRDPSYVFLFEVAYGCKRGEFGHSVSMQNPHIVFHFEISDHGWRDRTAANQRAIEERESRACLFHVLQKHHPNWSRGGGGGETETETERQGDREG